MLDVVHNVVLSVVHNVVPNAQNQTLYVRAYCSTVFGSLAISSPARTPGRQGGTLPGFCVRRCVKQWGRANAVWYSARPKSSWPLTVAGALDVWGAEPQINPATHPHRTARAFECKASGACCSMGVWFVSLALRSHCIKSSGVCLMAIILHLPRRSQRLAACP